MEFLVSFEAAEICYERLQAQAEKAASAARVMKLNNEFQASMRPQPKKPNFLEIPCVSCKEATLIPIGTKVLCDFMRLCWGSPAKRRSRWMINGHLVRPLNQARPP